MLYVLPWLQGVFTLCLHRYHPMLYLSRRATDAMPTQFHPHPLTLCFSYSCAFSIIVCHLFTNSPPISCLSCINRAVLLTVAILYTKRNYYSLLLSTRPAESFTCMHNVYTEHHKFLHNSHSTNDLNDLTLTGRVRCAIILRVGHSAHAQLFNMDC